MRPARILFDIETDGLLDKLTRIHCIVIRDLDTRKNYRYRCVPGGEDNLDDAIDIIENATFITGHNIIGFDLKAIEKCYPGFKLRDDCRTMDTLVMSRLVFPTRKESDFYEFYAGRLPGRLIGSHGLEAWGYRFRQNKGDYAERKAEEIRTRITEERAAKHAAAAEEEKRRAAEAVILADAMGADMGDTGFDYEEPDEDDDEPTKDDISAMVWADWSMDMEDYCEGDVNVNARLLSMILDMPCSEQSRQLEHAIHTLMQQQERNGIHFDIPGAHKLCAIMDAEVARFREAAITHFGQWFKPGKKHIIGPLFDPYGALTAEEIKRKKIAPKEYKKARPEFGEDGSRMVWGEVVVPKKTLKFKDKLKGDRTEGVPFCPVKLQQFNPGSRPQIIDRLTTIHGWRPVDFTEKGSPEVSDEVLRALVGQIPMAFELAELFYYNKRLGQIRDGKKAWLKKVTADGRIHHHCNVGGTLTGRASHGDPNLAQVPKVKTKKVKLEDGSTKTVILLGREGDHGYECRSLFYVPDGWVMVGCDLSGIELRCLGNVTFVYDGGELMGLVLAGDPHTVNMEALEITDRDAAKRFLYALMYGAGDEKLGSILIPTATSVEQIERGAWARAQVMRRLPGLAAAVANIKQKKRAGHLFGLDGRKLYPRSEHAALNTKLQSDGAILAKEWVVRAEEMMLDAGWKHGWDGDFVFLLWIHDEIQIACRPHLVEAAKAIMIDAARLAGEHFAFNCVVKAEAKHGQHWGATH